MASERRLSDNLYAQPRLRQLQRSRLLEAETVRLTSLLLQVTEN